MSSDTHKSPLQVPELVTMITDYLFPCDITNLMVTCKTLYHQLKPSFWKTVSIKGQLPTQESVIRNRQHIRSLHIIRYCKFILDVLATGQPPTESYGPFDLFPNVNTPILTSSGITNIRELIISYRYSEPSSTLALIRNSPYLVKLHFPSRVLEHCGGIFLRALSNGLPQLKELSVGESVSDFIEHFPATLFLLSCFKHPQLESLAFDFGIDFEHYTEESLNALLPPESRAENGSRSKITTIKLDGRGTYPISFVTRLILSHCHYLKRFEAPRITLDVTRWDAATAGISCVNLEHVRFPALEWSFDFTSFLFAECGQGIGLKTVSISSRGSHSGSKDINVIKSLLEHHSGTLEEIEITDYSRLEIECIHEVLSRCEKLKRLWVIGADRATECTEIITGDWVCSNLKELCLSLYIECNCDIDNCKDAPTSEIENVFQRIGQLHGLETLNLSWNGRGRYHTHETKPRWCLDYLATLSNLRQFHVTSSCWSNIDQSDVEFMHERWPHLWKIFFQKNQSPGAYQPYQTPSWQWLQKQRPHLQFLEIDECFSREVPYTLAQSFSIFQMFRNNKNL